MHIVNAGSARWSNANMTAAQAFESRCVDPSRAARSPFGWRARTASSPANTFEQRFTQETGSH